MGVKISWNPSQAPDIARYIVQRADNLLGAPFETVTEVTHAIPGPNYDAVTGMFFYLDPTGDTTKFYRLVSVDAVGQESLPSSPFQAAPPPPPPAPPGNIAGIRIAWRPSTARDIASYIIERADNITGAPFTFLSQVPHLIPGPNYDAESNTFFYLDPTGNETKFYRLISVDTVSQQSFPSTPFQAHVSTPVPPNNVKVDHNYPTPGNLRYQTASGLPIEAAYVRVYKKSDFDRGRTETPLAITMTNAQGNWVNPVSLTTGYTYVVQFAKESMYGPDKAEVIV